MGESISIFEQLPRGFYCAARVDKNWSNSEGLTWATYGITWKDKIIDALVSIQDILL